MRKTLTLLVIILIVNTSCKTDDDNGLSNTCNISNPVEELDWLKEIIAEIQQSFSSEEFYISQATYEGETIFISSNCCAVCNSVSPVYNCEGEIIGILGCGDDDINFKILEKDVVIWSAPNFICKDSDIFSCE